MAAEATVERILLKKKQDLLDTIKTGDPAKIVALAGSYGVETKQRKQYNGAIEKLQNINTTTN